MTTPNVVNVSYESFKILRGVPLCNNSVPSLNNVWFAAIPTLPGKIHDPNNYIQYGTYQSGAKPVVEPSYILVDPAMTPTSTIPLLLTLPVSLSKTWSTTTTLIWSKRMPTAPLFPTMLALLLLPNLEPPPTLALSLPDLPVSLTVFFNSLPLFQLLLLALGSALDLSSPSALSTAASSSKTAPTVTGAHSLSALETATPNLPLLPSST